LAIVSKAVVKDDNPTYKKLKTYWEIGIAFVIFSASILISIDKIKAELATGTLTGVFIIVKLAITLGWLLIFIHGDLEELELLQTHGLLKSDVLKAGSIGVGVGTLGLVVAIALVFGALIAFATHDILYPVLAIAIEGVDCIAHSIVLRAVYFATKMKTQRLSPSQEAVFDYWLGRPQFLRLLGMLSGFYLALLLALLATFNRSHVLKTWSSSAAVLTIIAGESVVYGWRRSRDRKLRN
jgi:hypothetical protein